MTNIIVVKKKPQGFTRGQNIRAAVTLNANPKAEDFEKKLYNAVVNREHARIKHPDGRIPVVQLSYKAEPCPKKKNRYKVGVDMTYFVAEKDVYETFVLSLSTAAA